MKFIDLINSCDLDKTCKIASRLKSAGSTKQQREKNRLGYASVLLELLGIKPVNKDIKKFALLVKHWPRVTREMVKKNPKKYVFTEGEYNDVCLKNLKYERPPNDLAIFKHKHYKTFAFLGANWETLINMEVIVEKGARKLSPTNEHILAEILWEITFHGWTNKEVTGFSDMLKETGKKIKDGSLKTRKLEVDDLPNCLIGKAQK